MKTQITTKNTTLTDGMKAYMDKRFKHFEKFLDKDDIVNVKIEANPGKVIPMKVEVTIPSSKRIIRAEKGSYDFYTCIDDVELNLTRSLRKRKERRIEKHRHSIPEVYEPQVVKEKVHELVPMTEDEACDAMEMTDHSFYVYLDSDRHDSVCVTYKREDGQYGLLIFK